MTTMSMPRNGRASRPTLSNQIDRLNTILDGLADALNGAVADAVKASVGAAAREAVAEALQEAMADLALARPSQEPHGAKAAAPAPPAPPQAPGDRPLLKAAGNSLGWLCALAGPPALEAVGGLSWAWSGCLAGLRAAASAVSSACQGAAALASSACSGVCAGLLPWLGGGVSTVAMVALGGTAMAVAGWLLL